MQVNSKILQKYKKMPIQAKASLWYTICNILQKGISFIVIPIYTRVLTTAQYGQYSVFQSWRDIVLIFATLNLYCGVFTKAMVEFDNDRDRYTSCMQGLSTSITMCLFLVYCTTTKFWNNVFGMDTFTIVLMFVYFVFYPSFAFWSVRQKVEYKYMKMIIVTLIVSVSTPVLSLLLLFFTELKANAVIWGYLFVQIAVGFVFYILQFYRGKVFFVKEYWKKALNFNIPLVPHYLSLIVLGQSDRIMIEYYCGTDKAGIYNLAYQVSTAMNVIVGAINGALVPWSYEQLKLKKYDELKNVASKICIILFLFTIIIFLLAPEIILILGDYEYFSAVWIVPAVAISIYFSFCYGLFSTAEFYFGATKFVMVASVIGAILNIVLNAICIPLFGFVAAGYTTAICYFTFMIMHYFFMKKICKRETHGNIIYDIKFILLSSFVISIIGILCMMLYNNFYIRYGIILLICILIFVFKNKFLRIIKEIRS